MTRLWDKGQPIDDAVLRFTVGEDHLLDARLVPYDARATTAHAQMLMEQGYLAAADFEKIRAALTQLVAEFKNVADFGSAEHAAGKWTIRLEDEDVHTALENRLIDRAGEAGARVHLGRSRNDQVLAALRLYLKDAVSEIAAAGEDVCGTLSALAERHGSIPLPGYTHMQRAMPSNVRLWAGGYASMLMDDVAGVRASLRRIDRNPLGSAAGYGTPALTIDRERTRALLGFAEVEEPVTAVQLSRGKCEAGLAFELTLFMQDLGRLAAEICLFVTSEYAFLALPARLTTGSSIMPQKKNPDLFELVRARSAQMAGELAQILALTAKMPSGYHRDLQLIKAPLFRAIDSTLLAARIMSHALGGIQFNPTKTEAAIDESLHATERVNKLVAEQGIPFRDAYRKIAGEIDDTRTK